LDGSRVDRYNEEIRQLGEAVSESVAIESGNAWNRGILERTPRYRTVAEFIGVDVVALSDFGGELGDPIAAAVKVDGWTRLQILAPSERSTWDPATEERFRNDVRRLASSHDLLERKGPVRLVFDPLQSSTETRDESSGEPIERD
jgi:hypothetical protein